MQRKKKPVQQRDMAMFEIKARLRQSGRVQWRDFYEYLDRRMLRGGGLEEEQGGDFWVD